MGFLTMFGVWRVAPPPRRRALQATLFFPEPCVRPAAKVRRIVGCAPATCRCPGDAERIRSTTISLRCNDGGRCWRAERRGVTRDVHSNEGVLGEPRCLGSLMDTELSHDLSLKPCVDSRSRAEQGNRHSSLTRSTILPVVSRRSRRRCASPAEVSARVSVTSTRTSPRASRSKAARSDLPTLSGTTPLSWARLSLPPPCSRTRGRSPNTPRPQRCSHCP